MCAVCMNFNLGVSILYLASNVYKILFSSSLNVNSFDDNSKYSK
ncbi:MAG: hypothetical protein Q8S84_00840 [bacterium]|nr:hypothetical protein [bacterium]